MNFLCLIYQNERERDAMSAAEWEALMHDCIASSEQMSASGAGLGGAALQPVRTAMTVRIRDGKPSITDGPFAETKEQLAGYYLIRAADMAEATRIAATLPPGRIGSVEVRPLWETGDLAVRRTVRHTA